MESGVYPASLTPQHADLSIDYGRHATHISNLLQAGCSGVALFGTTGEANSFSIQERMDALEHLVEAGISVERLLVGTGCCAIADAVSLTRHSCNAGAFQVLMLPPFYYKGPTDDGLFAYYDHVIQQVGDSRLRIVLYHFPKMSTVPLSFNLIERLLARYPETVIGLKDSSGDWQHMQELQKTFPAFQVFAGTERYLLPMLKAGGAGCITASANVTAPLAVDLFLNQNAPDAENRQALLTAARATIEQFPMIPALKFMMSRRPGNRSWLNLRPPLVSLTEEKQAALLKALERAPFTE